MRMSTVALSEISDAEWSALSSQRIFFGHQSVGRDIMLGVERVLEQHPEIALALVRTDDPAAVDGAAFIEARIGRNREPATKTEAFLNVLGRGFGDEFGVLAMYKFCYVDINRDTDPEQLFSEYAGAIEDTRDRFPGVTIVHFTMPLMTANDGLGERIRTALGLPTQTRLNPIRNRYNELVRERYAGTAPVFDLARLESTRADGSSAFTRHGGREIPMLAAEWTSDGGHLNEA